jgi:HD-GYP domain-containing protein (c-di-GMP phosphodiesterase class II)
MRITLKPVRSILTSIQFKVPVLVMALLALVTIALYAITVGIMSQRLLLEVIKRAESLGKSIAVSAGYSLISRDLLGLDNIVFTVKETNPDIEYIAITDTDMKTVAHSDMKKAGELFRPEGGALFRKSPDGTVVREVNAADRFEVMSPVMFKKKPLGTVVLGINRSVVTAVQEQAKRSVLVVFAVILSLGVGGSVLVSSLLTNPIRELSTGVVALKEGRTGRPLKVYSSDELGRLTERFNEMTTLITRQRDELTHYSLALEDAYISTVRVVSAALDARDPYTRGHSERVSLFSRLIAQRIGLEKREMEALEIACLFHDVGKIKTSDSILLKRGRLTSEEYWEMMQHTEYGAAILGSAPSLRLYIPAVRHHHERFDGTGYPDGLGGDKIPLHASIISIADAFDAMTSDRPYRDALPAEHALEELLAFSGSQFHPELVEAFVSAMRLQNLPDLRATKMR